MTEAETIRLIITSVQGLISLAAALGYRDAVISALDATLAAVRAQTDRDLKRKHRPSSGEFGE